MLHELFQRFERNLLLLDPPSYIRLSDMKKEILEKMVKLNTVFLPEITNEIASVKFEFIKNQLSPSELKAFLELPKSVWGSDSPKTNLRNIITWRLYWAFSQTYDASRDLSNMAFLDIDLRMQDTMPPAEDKPKWMVTLSQSLAKYADLSNEFILLRPDEPDIPIPYKPPYGIYITHTQMIQKIKGLNSYTSQAMVMAFWGRLLTNHIEIMHTRPQDKLLLALFKEKSLLELICSIYRNISG